MFLHVALFSEVVFKPRGDNGPMSVRSVLAHHIGRLLSIRGVVTRATEVKPLIRVATYTCDRCGAETYQVRIMLLSFIKFHYCFFVTVHLTKFTKS